MHIATTETVLARFAAHFGPSAQCAVMMPPVMMPMHMAVDATPLAVSTSAGGSFFLKLYAPDMLPFIDVPAAIEASVLAGVRGIGPAVVAHAADMGAILFEWLAPDSWRMARRDDLRAPETLNAVVQAKRAWHRGPPLGRTRSPFDVIRAHLATIAALGDRVPPLACLHTLRAWTDAIEQAIAAAGSDIRPLHGENTVSNVLLGAGNAVRLVDFDQAANGDPYYDLAALCLECCSFDDEVEAVVALYLGAPDRRALARVLAYMVVDDVLWGCWGLIAQATSPRSGGIEFYKYAQNRFLRCQYWLGIREFGALLRQL